MATLPQKLHSLEEFLERERRTDYRSEFHRGEIYAMAGGTVPHSRLAARMCAVFDRHFERCQIYDSNLMLYVPKADRCVYPDAMLLCGEPEYYDDHNDVILNPSVVVEVLSPSTSNYDKGPKTDYYRSIESIREILLISQEEIFVEHFTRQENGTWLISPYRQRANVIPALGAEIGVDEIYRGIL